jgi:hypothetical protein
MIVNQILGKILNSPAENILKAIFLLAFLVGVLSSLLVPAFFQLLELLPKRKAQRILDLNTELLHKYEGVCATLVEERAIHEKEKKENAELRRLNEERLQFDRYHDSRTRAAMKGGDQ